MKINQTSGLMDSKGKLIAELNCDKVGEFRDGMAVAEKDGNLGYVDRNLGYEYRPVIMTEKDFEVLDDGETIAWRH